MDIDNSALVKRFNLDKIDADTCNEIGGMLFALIPKLAAECKIYNVEFIDITVATDENGKEWAYQTGDNSFSGPCYHYPFWSTVSVCRDYLGMPARDLPAMRDSLLQEVINQLEEQLAEV